MRARRLLHPVLAALAAVVVCSPAFGADVTAKLSVRGGALTMAAPTRGIVIASLPKANADWRRTVRRLWVTVADRRGTGSGWALTLSAALRTADGRRVRGATASVWRVGVRCAGRCTRPRGVGLVPVRVDAKRPSRIVAARSHSGMGVVRLRIDVAVTVPATAGPGPYVLVPRVTRTSGP